ncbi:MAG: transcription antitermination factor NusB [Bacteroidales bacterium]|nr:transcription antitermination factor NusB [Bacteroidales bacterium]
MISRRLVRIKAMQTYYAFLQDSGDVSAERIWHELRFNIEKSHELYVYLHCLLLAVCDYAEGKIELNKKKHLPSHEDLNPNTRFINNKIFEAFRNNSTINNLYSNVDFNWSDYPEFIKSIWLQITTADYYKTYTSSEGNSIKEDIKIIDKIISKILVENSELDEILEEKSIFWNDDLEFLLSNIVQGIKKIKISEDTPIRYSLKDVFRDAGDEEFAKKLIVKAALHKDRYDRNILETLKKWELERIAFIDRVILHLALCEINEFPDMPVKVTINEYLEIAKYYSTEKSSLFINGILDKIYNQLKEQNLLNKKGLGLVE